MTMLILGLTGSIGMGKSTAAVMLRRLGLPVHDADAAVHALFVRRGAAVAGIAARFPGAVRDGVVDRGELGRQVFGDTAALQQLEAIVHPLVRRDRDRFLAIQRRRRARMVVLDVPLLFESGGASVCDRTIVISAPAQVQRQRVLVRADMTEAKFRAIIDRQMPDHEKRRRADWVVPSGAGRAVTFRCLKGLVRKLRDGVAATPARRRGLPNRGMHDA